MRLFLYPYTYKDSFFLSSVSDENVVAGVFMHENWKCDMDLLEEYEVQIYKTLRMDRYLDQCDGVMVCPDEIVGSSDLRPLFLKQIQLCLEHKKAVYCKLRLEPEEVRRFLELGAANGTKFIYMLEEYSRIQSRESTQEQLDVCNVPIVYVGEICENSGAKNLTAGISARLKQQGYRVCAILDDAGANLSGMYRTPLFLRGIIREQEKVLLINQYIKKLEREVQPDIFIVQVPGSIYQYSKKIFSDFGIYFFYYSQAFIPDLFFCAVPDNLCRDDMIKAIDKKTQACFGYGLDGVCRSRLYLDPLAAFRFGYIDYRFLECVRQEQELQYGVPIVEEGGLGCYDKFCRMIEETLGQESVEIL